MKPKIIHFIPHPPSYDSYRNSPRPSINWDLPNGSWVGIWGYDWPNLLAEETLKISDNFTIEVWQPDLRADKIYWHQFKNGIIHRLIPAYEEYKFVGFKKQPVLKSPELMKMVEEESKEKNTIIHLHGNLIELNFDILNLKNVPFILHSYHGDINLPINEIFRLRKNFPAIFNSISDHFKLKKAVRNISYLTYMNDTNIDSLEKLFKGEKSKVSMGCDFNFWDKKDKINCRIELNLPLDKKIFLSSSRLTPGKQIDKLISIFSKLKNLNNYYLIFTGNGSTEYENYLKNISKELSNLNLLRFTGYISEEDLLKYYSASDVFVLSSITEGAPVAVMKAFACELPILSTKVGHSATLLEKYNAGKLLDVYDYEQWKDEILKILNGNSIKPLDRKIAEEYYHWPNVAKKFINIYNKILKNTS